MRWPQSCWRVLRRQSPKTIFGHDRACFSTEMKEWLWIGFYHGAAMFWETLWALVLGFSVSAALQVFVSKEQMTRLLGRAGLREMLLATGFGAASSSCSYAAVAIGRSAFQKGAALIPALAFMFASTNLVVELGAVLWLLMGWRFVLAEVIGAFVLIGTMWLLMSIFFPKRLEDEAREHAKIDPPKDGFAVANNHHHGSCKHEHQHRLRASPARQATTRRRQMGENGERVLDGLADAMERTHCWISDSRLSRRADAARLVESALYRKR